MGNCLGPGGHRSSGISPTKEENVENGTRDVVDFRQIAGYSNLHIFTYNDLSLATNSFCANQILGAGGFGLVFKGAIDHNIKAGFEYTRVAVKKLNPEGFQGDNEWLAEVYYLGQLSHPNLVKLIGYCYEDEHRLLVYEYMAYGSLEKHLFKRSSATLPWLNRISIALDAAKGLAFLHGAERPIIYRDFKASNILIDPDYNGKLSDFGLAKEGPIGEQTHVSTRIMGTQGYAAPEYLLTGHLTARSDVYGFGVLLMELLIGQKVMDLSKPKRQQNLVNWARPALIHDNKLFKIIDPRMSGHYSTKEVEKVAKLAYGCTSKTPRARPVMSEVVDILSGVLKNEQDVQMETSKAVDKFFEVGKANVNAAAVKRKGEHGRRCVPSSN